MFLMESPDSQAFQKAKTKFLEKIRLISLKYLNSSLKINLPKSLEYIKPSEASWLLAISLLYNKHNEINFDNENLHKQAMTINHMFFEEIFANIHLPILNKLRNSDASTFDLTPSQREHALKLLEEKGVSNGSFILTEFCIINTYDFEGNAWSNYTLIRKDLLFKLIRNHSSLDDALDKEMLITDENINPKESHAIAFEHLYIEKDYCQPMSQTEEKNIHSQNTPKLGISDAAKESISPTSTFLKKSGSKGGKASKKRSELTILASYELRKNNKFVEFTKLLKKDYLFESMPCRDDLLYEGFEGCQDIYLINKGDSFVMHYTYTDDNNNTERRKIALTSLARYFSNEKKVLK